MSWDRWILFLFTDVLVNIAPGPAVLLVLSQGLTRGARPSLQASAGILTGSAIYFLVSATGLGALLIASYQLFVVVKWLGAGYLVYLGVRAFIRGGDSAVARPARIESGWRTYASGLALELGNPNALLFFVVILPQFIDPHRALAPQIAVLGATSIFSESIVLGVYGAFAGRFRSIAARPRFARVTERFAGSLFITAGIVAAASRRA